jgi:hypothetical protein
MCGLRISIVSYDNSFMDVSGPYFDVQVLDQASCLLRLWVGVTPGSRWAVLALGFRDRDGTDIPQNDLGG